VRKREKKIEGKRKTKKEIPFTPPHRRQQRTRKN
jgi:hypothetical protein